MTLNEKKIRRFFDKVNKTKTCWLWTGAQTKGAGNFHYGWFQDERAHRFSYKTFVGEIPKGYEIDHLCRITLCVNPKHLESVTHKENMLRGTSFSAVNSKKTKCPKGHDYYFQKSQRDCRICGRERWRKYYYLNKEKVLDRQKLNRKNRKAKEWEVKA